MLIPLRRVTDVDKKTAVIANAVGAGAYYMGVGGVIIPGATGHVFTGTSPNITPFVTGATSSSALILGVISSIICNGKVSEIQNVLGVNAAEVGATFPLIFPWNISLISARLSVRLLMLVLTLILQ